LAQLKLAVRAVNRRTVYFGQETRALLMAYKEWMRTQGHACGGEDKLFHGVRGPLTRYGIHERFDYWRKRLGFSAAISFHSLRHYYATWLLEQQLATSTTPQRPGKSWWHFSNVPHRGNSLEIFYALKLHSGLRMKPA
jgi:integrase